MLEIIKAIIYGIVEGVTEWLPISSTGHLILVEQLIPFQGTSEGFFDMFDVVIQLGAILAVVVLFWGQIWPFALTKKERQQQGGTGLMSYFKKDIWVLWFKILVSCVPAAVIGILFDDVFDALFYNPPCVAGALVVFGIAFILIENWNKGRKCKVTALSQITYQTALMIGVFQLIAAVFPGTSRSGATIVGALLIGVSRTVAAEYTFFLAIPVMFGWGVLKLIKYILAVGLAMTATEIAVLVVGIVTAFVVSVISIKFLMGYIKKNDFTAFGVYRIIVGIVVLAYFGVKVLL